MSQSQTLRRRDLFALAPAAAASTIADKLVVLTFDDAVKSHRSFVAPLLKTLGMRATFFVTHRWMADRENFMSWEEIAEIHRMGFEIGNHSWTHANFSTPRAAARLAGELALVENELLRVGVPKPVSFAWCGNGFGPESLAVLKQCGYRFARRGMQPEVPYGTLNLGPAFDPRRHHPLLIPTTGDAYPQWRFAHFERVIAGARKGQIVVLQFHGVPDRAHPWVHTPPENFERYMRHLKAQGYRTLALADLDGFFDWAHLPQDALLKRRHPEPQSPVALPIEVEATQANLDFWRAVMSEHGYSMEEAERVAGARVQLQPPSRRGLRLLPYPGGRHPRIGFQEGAIDPLRGAKASVFLPWPESGYVVIDLPEAIFSNLGLLFLAHTHLPTIWNAQNAHIENRDWTIHADGSLENFWRLPNGVSFGSRLQLDDGEVHMELWLENGTPQPLTGLRTQVCVLLKGAPEFAATTNENKILRAPVAGVIAAGGKRRILTEWERAGRVWANPRCPCFHSDPVFADCPPGERVKLRGRLWFESEPG